MTYQLADDIFTGPSLLAFDEDEHPNIWRDIPSDGEDILAVMLWFGWGDDRIESVLLHLDESVLMRATGAIL